VKAVEFGRQPHAHGARRRGRSDDNNVADARRPRPRDHFGAVGVEVGLIQVRMRVD
jgi:hypothetical protein